MTSGEAVEGFSVRRVVFIAVLIVALVLVALGVVIFCLAEADIVPDLALG